MRAAWILVFLSVVSVALLAGDPGTQAGKTAAAPLVVCQIPANSGFETGDLTSWTVDGSSNAPFVNGANPHSGLYSAVLGGFGWGSEPLGDSSFYQTITLPAGTFTLSFWFWPSTADSITFDWQDAYIEDSSGLLLATIMHTCSNAQTWTNQTFDLTPYAGQTIRIKFLVHQDGFGDMTGMYLDDVTISPCPTLFDLSFMDDYGRSQVCVNSSTGDWQWSVLKGTGAGKVYTGPGTVTTGTGFMRVIVAPGSDYGMGLVYYTTTHRATATFTYWRDSVNSPLFDNNTLDDPACGAVLSLPIGQSLPK